MNSCYLVRSSCAAVAAAARDVAIMPSALAAFAALLAEQPSGVPEWDDGGVHYADDADEAPRGGFSRTAAYVMVLDTLNFCFWPSATQLEYDVLARQLALQMRKNPASFSAEALSEVSEDEVRSWFAPHDLPNLASRTEFLRELGSMLLKYCGGDCMRLLSGSRHSAVAFVDLLIAYLPNLRDEAVYALPGVPGSARKVFFYKRAQIMVADAWAAFGRQTCTVEEAKDGVSPPTSPGSSAAAGGGTGLPKRLHPAAFYDIDKLTCFADYRIPQLLRAEGVLTYSAALADKVDSLASLPAGGSEEVEIRAVTVTAVEVLRKMLAEQHGQMLTSVELDWRLWQMGEVGATTGDRPLARSSPHHRTDTVYY